MQFDLREPMYLYLMSSSIGSFYHVFSEMTLTMFGHHWPGQNKNKIKPCVGWAPQSSDRYYGLSLSGIPQNVGRPTEHTSRVDWVKFNVLCAC